MWYWYADMIHSMQQHQPTAGVYRANGGIRTNNGSQPSSTFVSFNTNSFTQKHSLHSSFSVHKHASGSELLRPTNQPTTCDSGINTGFKKSKLARRGGHRASFHSIVLFLCKLLEILRRETQLMGCTELMDALGPTMDHLHPSTFVSFNTNSCTKKALTTFLLHCSQTCFRQ